MGLLSTKAAWVSQMEQGREKMSGLTNSFVNNITLVIYGNIPSNFEAFSTEPQSIPCCLLLFDCGVCIVSGTTDICCGQFTSNSRGGCVFTAWGLFSGRLVPLLFDSVL